LQDLEGRYGERQYGSLSYGLVVHFRLQDLEGRYGQRQYGSLSYGLVVRFRLLSTSR